MLKRLFARLFKPGLCSWRDPKCYKKQTGWGCVCGKGGEDKAAQRQEDLTRQQTAAANAEANQLRSRQQGLADTLRAQLLESIAQNPLEAQRIAWLTQNEPEFASLLKNLSTGAQQSPQIIPYESTFEPEFALLKDKMSSEAAARGIYGSGLQVENMGRAGVELAIRQAEKRQANKQLNEQLGASRRGEFSQFLGNQQNLEDVRRGREISGRQQAGILPAEIMQGANVNAADITGQARQANFNQEIGDVNFYRQKQAQNDAAMGQLLGAGVGLGANFLFPGSGAFIGPMVGGAMGGGGQNYGMGTPPFNPYGGFAASRGPSGADLRASYRYGSQRPGFGDRMYGGNW